MDSLLGITFENWWKLLGENRFAVDFPYWPKALFLTFLSLVNSIDRRKEERLYRSNYESLKIKEPVFILGHWRSGTTLLHTLMAQDAQFAYPTLFQVSNPHTFLVREAQSLRSAIPQKFLKRPMDNMKVSAQSPGEDEFAISIASLRSPLIAWSFPRREAYYNQFLTFQEAKPEDVRSWEVALLTFLRKLTWNYSRPLLLKSPAHTGRIRMLLELFPDARFIHIRREPYQVFQSTLKLYEEAIPHSRFQRLKTADVSKGIFNQYIAMYEAYFKERVQIPGGRLFEISFEDLEKDMVRQIANIYESLGLAGFGHLLPRLQHYVESISNYKKNSYKPLSPPLRKKIAQLWRRNFTEWGYSV